MAAVAAVAGIIAIGTSIYQGEKQKDAQKRAMRAQEAANRESLSQAAAQQRQDEMEARQRNRMQPEIDAILAGERARAMMGGSATSLTGPGGATVRPKLGGSSLLGGTPA